MIRDYIDFSGGLNTKEVPPIVVDKGDTQVLKWAEEAYNWEMSEAGLIAAIGYIAVLSSAISGTPLLTGVFEYNGTNGRETLICAGGKVYTVTGSSANEIFTGHTAGKFYTSCEWDDGTGTPIILLMNGTDDFLVYDGTNCVEATITDDASPIYDTSKPYGADVFRGRIFFYTDDKILTPRPNTYNNFDNTLSTVDAFNVDSGFGGKITGVKALTDGVLVIFKERAIRRLSGSEPFGSSTDPFTISPVSNEVGCVARRTIVQAGKGLEIYFLSQDGVRKLQPVQEYGDIDPLMPSYAIQDEVNQWNFDGDAIKDACAVFVKKDNAVYLSVPYGAATTNNKTYVFDTVTGGVDPRGLNDFTVASMGVVGRKLITGDYAGEIFRWGDNNGYNGAEITRYWKSKVICHDSMALMKAYRELCLYAEADGAGDVTVAWRVLQGADFIDKSSTESVSSGGALFDSAVFDTAVWSTGEQKMFRIKDIGRGQAIQLILTNTSATQRPKIRLITVNYDSMGFARD